MELNTPYARVRDVDRSGHETVLHVLASAFDTDPLAEWLFPETADRAALRTGFHRSLLDRSGAECHVAGDREGAAIWLPLQAGERLHDGQAGAAVRDERLARLRAVGEALAARHPVGEPHLYLAVMGVVSDRRGHGIGTALLRHRLQRADRDGIGTYLEAGSPRSRALYLRHGFADLGHPVRIADAPPLQPMWRPAAVDAGPRPTDQTPTVQGASR